MDNKYTVLAYFRWKTSIITHFSQGWVTWTKHPRHTTNAQTDFQLNQPEAQLNDSKTNYHGNMTCGKSGN